MNVQTKKVNGANSEITATIDTDTINKSVEKIAKQLSRTANISGFRKGKVPVAIIKKTYGEKLLQDAENEVLRDVVDEGIKSLGISNENLIGEPAVTKYDKNDDTIEVAITLYNRPEVDLGDYTKIVPEVKKPKITKKAVTDRIKELAQSQAALKAIEEDRGIENGDTALIDFDGYLGGEPFPGGKAEQFALEIGSGQFIPGFEEQLIGMRAGEEKDIKVTFPEDYQSEELAGKEALFKIKLHEIQEKEKVRIDKKLAEKMLPGEENADVDMLNEKVQEQLEQEALSKLYNDELKPALIEKFVTTVAFDLPSFIVDQEIDNAVNREAQAMKEEELNELKENPEKIKELREKHRPDAEKSVKATFIIDTLAAKESVSVSDQEVKQTIFYEAMQMGQDPQSTLDQYEKAGYLPAVQMAMVEDRVLSKLLDAAIKEA